MLGAASQSLRLTGVAPSTSPHLLVESKCNTIRTSRCNHSRASNVTVAASLSFGNFGNHDGSGGNGPPHGGGGGGKEGGDSWGSSDWGRSAGLVSLAGLSLLAAGPAAAAKPKEKTPRPGVVLDPHANDGTELTVEKVTDLLWKVAGPIATNLGFSGGMGLVAGVALKKVGMFVAVLVGLAFATLQGLAYAGMITVNWTSIESSVKGRFDANKDGKLDKEDFKLFMDSGLGALSAGVPSVGGFLAGLVLGFRF